MELEAVGLLGAGWEVGLGITGNDEDPNGFGLLNCGDHLGIPRVLRSPLSGDGDDSNLLIDR
jgi:hypothetical protein